MYKAIYSVVAATVVVSSTLLLSTPASASCTNTKNYNGSADTVSCNATGDQGSNFVTRPGGGSTYNYAVSGFGVESFAQGFLLNAGGSVVSGTRTDGTFGACQEFFFVVGSNTRTFKCQNATAAVAKIKITVE